MEESAMVAGRSEQSGVLEKRRDTRQLAKQTANLPHVLMTMPGWLAGTITMNLRCAVVRQEGKETKRESD
jgi:hypothetical protein